MKNSILAPVVAVSESVRKEREREETPHLRIIIEAQTRIDSMKVISSNACIPFFEVAK